MPTPATPTLPPAQEALLTAVTQAAATVAALVHHEMTLSIERAQREAELVAAVLGTPNEQTGRPHSLESAGKLAAVAAPMVAIRHEAAEVARDLVLARAAYTVARLRAQAALGVVGGAAALPE